MIDGNNRKEYFKEYVRRPKVKEKSRDRVKKWRLEHPLTREQLIKRREKRREYYRTHKEQEKLSKMRGRRKIRAKIIQLLGGQCANPYGLHDKPFTDIQCLQIDHVNGGGNKERSSLSVWKYYKKVLLEIQNGSKDYQCLCANCNFKKRNNKNQLV